jgi:hypothetical protein
MGALLITSCSATAESTTLYQGGEAQPPGRLIVLPANATAEIGDTVQFRAVLITPQQDTVVARPVDWRSANPAIARISSTGSVVVLGEGLAGITALYGAQIAVSSVIGGPRVRPDSLATTPAARRRVPALPGSGDGRAPTPRLPQDAGAEQFDRSARSDATRNEPPGFRLINDRHFRTKVPLVRRGAYPTREQVAMGEGWDDVEARYPRFSIQPDATAPSGDGLVGQMFYPAGMRSGVGPASAYLYMPNDTKEVYISFWMKLSPDWSGNQASVNKMFFFGVSEGNNQFVFVAYGSYGNPLQARIHLQGMNDDDAHGSAHRPNSGAPSMVRRGQWQQFEFVLRCNSAPGVPDGSMEMWVDGQKTFQEFATDWTLKSRPNRPCSMHVLNWNPTFGGGGKAVPHDQWQRVDRIYISGR